MSYKKIDKEFVLSDSSINCYNFQLLTSGYDIAAFQKNPIGYYMHKRDDGVVLRWDDLKIKGDKVVGKPIINLSNARGPQTLVEVEEGFLNAASVGGIVVLDFIENPTTKMITITKWYNQECSLVDVPGNNNALTELYDRDNNPMTLADLMGRFTGAGTPGNDYEAYQKLSYDELWKQDKLPALKVQFPELYKAKHKARFGTEPISDYSGMKPQQGNSDTGGANNEAYEAYQKLSYDELWRQDKLPALKAQFPELYKAKHKARFGKEPIEKETGKGRWQGDGSNNEAYEAFQKLSYDELWKQDKLPALKAQFPELYKAKHKAKWGKEPE